MAGLLRGLPLFFRIEYTFADTIKEFFMDIDLVVLWVDGTDPAWLAEKKKYEPEKLLPDGGDNRYRDWGRQQIPGLGSDALLVQIDRSVRAMGPQSLLRYLGPYPWFFEHGSA